MENKPKKAARFFVPALIITACFAVGFGIGYFGDKLVRRAKAPADGEYTITLCSTTDIHGAYFDKDFDGVPQKSSLANVSSFLKELRGTGCDPVLIDCGDNLQGSNAAYFYNYVDTSNKHIFTQMQQYLGYDVLVVGNHDIETGHPVYDRMRKEAGIPMLATNAINSTGRNAGKPYFDEYTIVKRGKIKIAVIGMTNPNIKNWLPEPLWKGIDFLEVASVAQETIDRVNKKEKPHITILAMHSGNGIEGCNIESEGLDLAKTLKGVNVIFCGHDHKTAAQIVENPNGNVLLIDSGSKSRFVSDVDLKVTVKNRRIESVEPVKYEVMEMEEYLPDPDFVSHFLPEYEKVVEFATKPVCKLNKDLIFDAPMDGPNEYVTLIHRTQLYVTKADVSFAAPLTFAGSLSAGEVNFNGLSKIYCFENTLYKIELTGKQIKDYLEFSYDNWINNTAARYNLDSAEGIEYTVKISNEKGNRVDISSLSDGREFDENQTYTVALTSYRASGGGYHLRDGAGVDPKDITILERFKDIRSLVGEYMKTFEDGYTPEKSHNWSFVE